jgi:hypothetical protein
MERILLPYLGASMSRAALEVARRKIGIAQSEVRPSEIEPLIEHLRPGLQVFLGTDQTQRILGQIRAALSWTERRP